MNESVEQEDRATKTVQAVDRAFAVIEALSRNGSMTLGDLNKIISVNKASLLRLLFTLTENGYVRRDEPTGAYSLSLKLYEIGAGAINNFDHSGLVYSTLSDLNRATGRIAQFSIEDGNDLICIQSVGHSTSFFSVYTVGGYRSPLYCTGAGKALLATYSNTQVAERWSSFEAHNLTKNTIVDLEEFLQDLDQIRRRQYALDIEENEYGVFCLGTVVMGSGNKPVGAISITGNSLTEEEERQIAAQLVPAARALSRSFGYLENALITP